ncbi:MAG: hypothetical protein WB770_00570 [Acidimicrobiales bacterium]
MRLWLGLLAIVLAVAASQTRVFTDGSDIVTAVALVLFVTLSAARRWVIPLIPGPGTRLATPIRVPARSIVVWTALAAGAIGFEVFNYAETPRHSHPTVSAALTVLATNSISRGVSFFAWVVFGAWIALS